MIVRPSHLRRLARIVKPHLPDRCTIERRTPVSDGAGDYTVTYPVIATNVPVLLTDALTMKAIETVSNAKLTTLNYYQGLMLKGQDLKATDRIVVTTLGNRVFEVDGMLSASYEAVRQFTATEIL